MLLSLSLIFILGIFFAYISEKLRLPRIVGMIFAGILIGPFVLNLLDASILSESGNLRTIALIVILLKAGFSLDLDDLKKVGRPALLMSFMPALFEIIAYAVFAPYFLGVSRIDAIIIGSVLGAVSPAIVVPKMVSLLEEGYGTKKSIPQLVLAGSSCDDIFVIVVFTTFTGMAKNNTISALSFVNIPISIISGIFIGVAMGFILYNLFEKFFEKDKMIRNSKKLIIILAIAFLFKSMETILEDYFAFSGLIAIICMAMVIKAKSVNEVSERLSQKSGKIWLAAEIILFVLVGASVDISYTLSAGPGVIGLIFTSLIIRSLGVTLALMGTALNKKERLFVIFSYLPKATVQAAIGGLPLAMGLSCGKICLSVAVAGILITAPLGAFLMDFTTNKLLEKNS